MGCFSESLIIWIIEVIALVLIIRVVVPWAVSFFGIPAPAAQIINIIIWAIIAIWGVIILFNLFSCFGGGHLTLIPHT